MVRILTVTLLFLVAHSPAICRAQRVLGTVQKKLVYTPAPADNPLKGFFPFRGDHRKTFPHSMEWCYFPLNELMNGPASFTFEKTFEPALNDIAARGHQATLRVVVDSPAKPTGVPEFLISEGLRMRPYTEHGGGQSPDWNDERLIRAFELFIAEFGRRYDGDPRLGFITIGLLGFWGEWHTYPHTDWFPDHAVQNRILSAYTKAFRRTRLLVRRPAADAVRLPIGFHDDSFAFSTLPTVEWHFLAQLKTASMLDRWKTQPIGGELRPELQAAFWNRPLPRDLKYEDFSECVRRTHCSWLINHELFNRRLPKIQYERALSGARQLGYELHVSAVRFLSPGTRSGILVQLTLENRGVAPFYYDWPVIIQFQNQKQDAVHIAAKWKLTTLLPGRTATWTHLVRDTRLQAGRYIVSLSIPNPLVAGMPLQFANQGRRQNGQLLLGTLGLE